MPSTHVLKAFCALAVAMLPALAAQAQPGSRTPAILTDMSGTWDVEQTMWTGAGAQPQPLPKAVAQRSLAAGAGFIEEVMTLAGGAGGEPFTRTSHINYNAMDRRFEYFSIDTRAPQQMTYRSSPAAASSAGPFRFQGGTFVAREWGARRNATFAYRVELTPVVRGRQRLTLFLRPIEAGRPAEFKAFEYSYVRRD